MIQRRVGLVILMLGFLLLGCGGYSLKIPPKESVSAEAVEPPTSSVSSDEVKVRFLHATPGMNRVNVNCNRKSLFTAVGYGESSGYQSVPKGDHWFEVLSNVQAARVISRRAVTFHLFSRYTTIFVPRENETILLTVPDESESSDGRGKIRVVNGMQDSIPLDFKLSDGRGAPFFSGLGAFRASKYKEIQPGSYSFVFSPMGGKGVVIGMDTLEIKANGRYTILLFGTLKPKDEFPSKVRVFRDDVQQGKSYIEL